ncbi:MAG: hypothetical protein VR73_01170 [Gammaproteobacteria bacterium BRH_c0]|nr:MAG: hypothetical protein VR73_01170 [Gammaproteobacteria bacterium BRH_c0]
MELTPDICYSALLSRDPRFDGRFFVGVSSTRIYCRPVCRVKPPKAANSHFFSSAAAAEKAGYRPCLRCRPEIAPGYAPVDSGQNLAWAARTLMDQGLLDQHDSEVLASRLGISSRYMRKIFQREFGVSPVEYNQSRRLLLAKQLLTDTRLSLSTVAMAAGFNSLQRFNATFREKYQMPPSKFRSREVAGNEDGVWLELGYRPPYAWEQLLHFLQPRLIAGVEAISNNRYRRVVAWIDSEGKLHSGWFEVSHLAAKQRIGVKLAHSLLPQLGAIRHRLGYMLDLAHNPVETAAALHDVESWCNGLRIPGCIDGFEAAVRAIVGQQISVTAAIKALHRFVDRFGIEVATPFADLTRAFPPAATIAGLSVAQIAELGIIRQRANAIIELAKCSHGDPGLLQPGLDPEDQIRRLMAIPGIGDWTAQYIALRALSHTDAFPAADAGVLAALSTMTGYKMTGNKTAGYKMTAAQARQLSQQWRPWRSYMTVHLWNLNQPRGPKEQP